jgi:hypothetical protein
LCLKTQKGNQNALMVIAGLRRFTSLLDSVRPETQRHVRTYNGYGGVCSDPLNYPHFTDLFVCPLLTVHRTEVPQLACFPRTTCVSWASQHPSPSSESITSGYKAKKVRDQSHGVRPGRRDRCLRSDTCDAHAALVHAAGTIHCSARGALLFCGTVRAATRGFATVFGSAMLDANTVLQMFAHVARLENFSTSLP